MHKLTILFHDIQFVNCFVWADEFGRNVNSKTMRCQSHKHILTTQMQSIRTLCYACFIDLKWILIGCCVLYTEARSNSYAVAVHNHFQFSSHRQTEHISSDAY